MTVRRLLIAVLLVAGCGGSGNDPTESPVVAGATPRQAAVQPRASTVAPAEVPDVVFDLGVQLTKKTASVARGANASVTIKTTKGAECGIDVQYKAGSSTAKALEPKVANAKGAVTWKWAVERSVGKGTVPIVVTCTLGDQVGRLDTRIKVT